MFTEKGILRKLASIEDDMNVNGEWFIATGSIHWSIDFCILDDKIHHYIENKLSLNPRPPARALLYDALGDLMFGMHVRLHDKKLMTPLMTVSQHMHGLLIDVLNQKFTYESTEIDNDYLTFNFIANEYIMKDVQ